MLIIAPHQLRIAVVAALLAAGCAQSIPEKPGAYAKVGREWVALDMVNTAVLQRPVPTDLEALQKTVHAFKGDAEIVFVGRKPARAAALVRDGEGWKPVSTAAMPHESRDNVWALSFDGGAPSGLVLVKIDDPKNGIAFVNGADAAYSYALGVAYQKKGDLAAAREALEVAEEAAPKAAHIKNQLARVLAESKKDLGTALSRANDAIALAATDPERAVYYDTLGEVYFVDGEVTKGIDAVDRAIQLDLRNPAFHTHLTALIEKAQEQPPEAVFNRFYELLAARKFGDAADLVNEFDVERLDDADRLEPTLQEMAKGAPWARIEILETLKHGRHTRVKFALIGQDGSRRIEDTQLQFEKTQWTVSLK